MSRLCQSNKKRDYSKVNPFKTELKEDHEPECLVIPSTGEHGSTAPLVLVPFGSIGKRTVYVECQDQQELADFGLGPEVLSDV